jgi:hypothetical protein
MVAHRACGAVDVDRVRRWAGRRDLVELMESVEQSRSRANYEESRKLASDTKLQEARMVAYCLLEIVGDPRDVAAVERWRRERRRA